MPTPTILKIFQKLNVEDLLKLTQEHALREDLINPLWEERFKDYYPQNYTALKEPSEPHTDWFKTFWDNYNPSTTQAISQDQTNITDYQKTPAKSSFGLFPENKAEVSKDDDTNASEEDFPNIW